MTSTPISEKIDKHLLQECIDRMLKNEEYAKALKKFNRLFEPKQNHKILATHKSPAL